MPFNGDNPTGRRGTVMLFDGNDPVGWRGTWSEANDSGWKASGWNVAIEHGI